MSAKKQTKKSGAKGRAQAQAQGPLVVLYGVLRDTERGAAIRALLADQGITVRTMLPEHLNNSVGYTAGLASYRAALRPFTDEPPAVEFMLMCNFTNAQQSALLAAMREAGLSIGAKAVLTAFNKDWPFWHLVQQVSEEHAQMMAQSAAAASSPDERGEAPLQE